MNTKKEIFFNVWGLLGLLMVIFTAPVHAQDEEAAPPTILSNEAPSLRFEHLGLEDGLAQASGNTIMQDSQGFLWIATQGGLHRYDGHEFKVYSATPFDTTSLSESWVWAATEATNGDLWVTTEDGGLNRLDPSTGRATHYRHNPEDSTSISSDRTFFPLEAGNGDLWVSTLGDGLNRMRAGEDSTFSRYRHDPDDPNSLSHDVLFWINEDPDGQIWVGSANGINRIDPETDMIRRFLYDTEGSRGYGAPQNVLGQYLPSNEPGILWLATGNGLVRLDSKTGLHERFLIEPNSGGRPNPLNFIHEVRPDPADPGVLWVGGPGTGIARFDTRTETFTAYRHNPRDPNSLSDNVVTSLFTDRSGTMWAGTASEGLSAFNPGAVNFIHLRYDSEDAQSLAPGIVWGVYEDREGSLWVGTDVGSAGNYLSRFNTKTGEAQRFQHDPNDTATLPPGNYRTFAEDNNGGFWVAGGGGLSRLDRATGQVTRFRHEQTEENRGRNNIFALLPSPSDPDMLWIGGGGPLDRFDTRTGRFMRFPLEVDGIDEILGIWSLMADTEGILWAGSPEGLLRIDPAGEVTIASAYNSNDTTTISDNNINSIAERAKEPGILWLSTQNGGLNRFDTRTGIATHYTEEDGLANNHTYSVLTDQNGTLWMSTNGGISNFDPETETFRNYGLDDGLMALEYNQNAFAKGAGGVLYFGSGKGVTAFTPEQLHINEIPPQVVLSGLKLFNKPIVAGPESPLKMTLAQTGEIILKHDQNEITFDFVALHFANPAKNQYAYQLEGFDTDWVDAGTRRSATYTNLAPGDYNFKVKAANADGVWNEKGASILLSILPPWYRTWWAYILFALLLGSAVFGVDRVQRRRLSNKEQERAALREAELRAEAENKRRADTEQLSKIGRAITSTLSVHKIIDTVYENVNELMDAEIFGVGIYNKEKNRLDFPATKEKGEMLPPYVNRLDEENRLAVLCFKGREEIIIGNFQQEHSNYIKTYKPPVEGKDATSILYLPLVQQDRVIGVITTQSFTENAYTAYHINLLRNLATYAAIALDNAAAYRQLNATLSELKTMQQQLVQQEKLASLGQLTAGIAHEIKNPLNFVNNFSEVSMELVDEVKDELSALSSQLSEFRSQKSENSTQRSPFASPSEASHAGQEGGVGVSDRTEAGNVKKNRKNADVEYALSIINDIEANLRKINEHGVRADSIVKSMLLHSRSGGSKMEPTDLNALIKEYANLAFHGMRASKNPINVEIELQLDENVRKVPLIAEDFSRVIVNLCNNAFDAMREKLSAFSDQQSAYQPKLMVRTNRASDQVIVEIEDNGPGIPEEIRDRILQPFFTTKKGTEGTGLGLSITNDIVKAHGGELEIESQPGVFTRFIIKLPIKAN